MSTGAALVAALAAVIGALVSAAAARRSERKLMASTERALARLRAEAAQSALLAAGVESAADSRALLELLLRADEIQILMRTKQGVALDLAQLCSATALPPSRARDSITRLMGLGLLGAEHDKHGAGSAVRYRKQVADSLIGGAG